MLCRTSSVSLLIVEIAEAGVMGPGLGNLLGEFRALGELATFASDAILKPESRENLDLSDRDATSAGILLVPGFMASDATLFPLARRLERMGQRVFFAGIWCNADCPAQTMRLLEQVLRGAARMTGDKVIVLGHSLGGIYARELARFLPDLVERAILLGAPLKNPVESTNHPIKEIATLMMSFHRACLNGLGGLLHEQAPSLAPEVPETIVYTRSDGIVDWRSCLESGPRVEAVEVSGSHCGLAMNVEVWNVIKSRLKHASATPGMQARTRDEIRRPPPVLKRPAHFRPPYLHLVKRPPTAA